MPSAVLLNFPINNPVELGLRLNRGLRFSSLSHFLSVTGFSLESLAQTIQVSRRTLLRRRMEGRLRPTESDRLYRFAAVFQKAVDFFHGDVNAAKQWLTTPATALKSKRPIALLHTSPGSRAVEELLAQLEHGIFP